MSPDQSATGTRNPETMCGVYAIENKINGMRYIGSDAVTFAKRWSQHRRQLQSRNHRNPHLQSAWNLYGETAFSFLIITACQPSDCVSHEQAAIDSFDSANRLCGYNIAPKAGSRLGVGVSQATRDRISASLKGRKGKPHTAEARAKMSAAKKGRAGRPMSNDNKKKLLLANKGKKRTPENRAKIAEALTGSKQSAATVAKRAAANKGKKRSPEFRKRASEWMKLARKAKFS